MGGAWSPGPDLPFRIRKPNLIHANGVYGKTLVYAGSLFSTSGAKLVSREAHVYSWFHSEWTKCQDTPVEMALSSVALAYGKAGYVVQSVKAACHFFLDNTLSDWVAIATGGRSSSGVNNARTFKFNFRDYTWTELPGAPLLPVADFHLSGFMTRESRRSILCSLHWKQA